MKWIEWILTKLVAFAGLVGLACVVLMMVHIVCDVLGRYLFNMPVEGTITIVSNYYMVILAFGSLAVSEARDANISVEIVSDLLPRNVQPSLTGLASLIAVGAFSLLAVRGWIEASDKFSSGAALQQGIVTIPIWPSYFAVPLGCGLMALASAWKLVCLITGRPFAISKPDPEAFNE